MSDHSIQLDFKKLKSSISDCEVMPVVVQDHESKEVLMVAFANADAVEESFRRGIAVFWSTSRQELWIKGETSGDTLKLLDVRTNCYGNSLLYTVKLVGKGMCHTKDSNGISRFGCYYRHLKTPTQTEMVTSSPYSGT
jgi:phosphoribosyl-AMP cyclohydrolase